MNGPLSFLLALVLLALAACSPHPPAPTTTPGPAASLTALIQATPTRTPAKGPAPRVLVLPSVVPTHTPRAGWPPGKIVFTCQWQKLQASEQICMIDADDPGAAQTLTWMVSVQRYYASLAPDGLSMVYANFLENNLSEIYELGWGENPPDWRRPLTDGLSLVNAPEISPDGRQIIFMRQVAETGRDEIWVMARDGRSPRRLIDTVGWDPTWSPDGQQVLFASDRGGNIQLWVVGVDGTGLHKVTDLPGMRGRSDWSPDGQYIVTDLGGPWEHELYLMDSDGSNAHRISPPGGNSQGPSFSPDGKWVAFTAYFDHPNDINGCEIYIMRIDGTDLRRLTDNDFCDYQPRWGP